MQKKKQSFNTQQIVKAIYLLSLAEVLHKRIVMQKLNDLMVKNHYSLCKSKYNPPS
jgi:hypothetical protein